MGKLGFLSVILRRMYTRQLVKELNDTNITILTENYYHKRESLKQLISFVPGKNKMVEIGSLAGFSTRLFSLYFNQVISIDPYQHGYDQQDMNSNKFRLLLGKDLFTIRFFDDPRVRQIREHSEEAVKRFKDEEFDFVYIDAGHNYEAVKTDIVLWRPKVKCGSFIAGDDYDRKGVKQAVKEEFQDYQIIDNRWIAKKTCN